MKILSLTVALSLSVAGVAAATTSTVTTSIPTYSATVLLDRATTLCTLISPTAETQRHRGIHKATNVLEQTKLRQNRTPQELLANEPDDLQQFVYVLGGSVSAVEARIAQRCANGIRANPDAAPPPMAASAPSLRGSPTRSVPLAAADVTEIRKIVDSGDPANRIDVVFMGDAYTLNEKTQFFDDITRLTTDMFTGDTFAQYLPLFNIWAAYVPSVESGIGVGGKPRDTAFQLYRDGTELRGVYSKNPQAARDLCKSLGAQKACDFPSLIGNDDFYGGLGGEFVIATRSQTTGTVVLRHEMGHNFGQVGEEYDGGYVYRGANSASSLSRITWNHWLTDPTRLVEEKVAQLYQKHIWYDLKQGAYTIKFTSTGLYKRWFLQFSVSGTDTNDSISVTLDGRPLEWKSNGLKDRSFYQWFNSTSGFSAGPHELVIQANGNGSTSSSTIIKQLCNAVIHEYADENEFKLDDRDYIGIYPSYDINKVKSFRPDNEKCLMRNMTSTSFCTVCQENMWLQFLARVEFIDSVSVVNGTKVELAVVPLGQQRLPSDPFVTTNPEIAAAEKYVVQWFRKDTGEELLQFRDQFQVDLAAGTISGGRSVVGTYTVRLTFTTPSVRKDPNNYMQSERSFTIE